MGRGRDGGWAESVSGFPIQNDDFCTWSKQDGALLNSMHALLAEQKLIQQCLILAPSWPLCFCLCVRWSVKSYRNNGTYCWDYFFCNCSISLSIKGNWQVLSHLAWLSMIWWFQAYSLLWYWSTVMKSHSQSDSFSREMLPLLIAYFWKLHHSFY